MRGLFNSSRPPMRDVSDFADDSLDGGRYGCPVQLRYLGQFMLKVGPCTAWRHCPSGVGIICCLYSPYRSYSYASASHLLINRIPAAAPAPPGPLIHPSH